MVASVRVVHGFPSPGRVRALVSAMFLAGKVDPFAVVDREAVPAAHQMQVPLAMMKHFAPVAVLFALRLESAFHH